MLTKQEDLERVYTSSGSGGERKEPRKAIEANRGGRTQQQQPLGPPPPQLSSAGRISSRSNSANSSSDPHHLHHQHLQQQQHQQRTHLMDRLQSFLPPSVMLPPRRLMQLLRQACVYQAERCPHYNADPEDPAALQRQMEDLATDVSSSDRDFPCETIQTLNEHCEEVFYCKFSPDGLKLATGSKDQTVIVWDFDPATLSLSHGKTLERQPHGISFFAWSPDSKRLAVCGPEDCDEVRD